MNDHAAAIESDREFEKIVWDLVSRKSTRKWLREEVLAIPPAPPTPDLIPPECLPLMAALVRATFDAQPS